MALPKILIRSLRPYVVILAIVVGYASFQQYQTNKAAIYAQSQANLRTATKLAREQMKNSVANFNLLENAWRNGGNDLANQTAYQLLTSNQNFADIIRFDQQSRTAISERQVHIAKQHDLEIKQFTLPNLNWSTVLIGNKFYQLSNMYKNIEGRWVFALTNEQQTRGPSYYIEFDLLQMTQLFIDLRTLDLGFVFVMDRTTGRIIFHPHPHRVGHTAAIFEQSLKKQLDANKLIGRVDYYFKDQFKVAEYNAYNDLNWVFVSGALRSDILSYTYSHFLIFLVSITLILVVVIFNYLVQNLRKELHTLNRTTNLQKAKEQTLQIFRRFCTSKRVQVCFYQPETKDFYTLDYHGKKQLVLRDQAYAHQISGEHTQHIKSAKDDALATQLQFSKRYYRIPLYGRGRLLGVIFAESWLPTYASLINLLKTYIENTLSNLQLNEKLYQHDTATDLDNLFTLRQSVRDRLRTKEHYLLTLEVDDLKQINYQYGYSCGDQVILAMADIINEYFPDSESNARIGDDEFAILFKCEDHSEGFALADKLREAVESLSFIYDDKEIFFTASAGISLVQISVDETLKQAQQALQQSKRNGKNQTTMNVL